MKNSQIEKLGALAALIKERRLRASGGAESLAWTVAMRGGADDVWNQRFGIEGIWAQMIARFPLPSRLSVATLSSLGITLTGETRFGEVLDAAIRQGLRLCPYGTVPLLLASGVRLSPTGSRVGDAYRRVVACTDPIGAQSQLFAFRNEPGGDLCACGCYGGRDVRLIELFSDEGFSFGGVPADQPDRDIGFLFQEPETQNCHAETGIHSSWDLHETEGVAILLEATASPVPAPTIFQKRRAKNLLAA